MMSLSALPTNMHTRAPECSDSVLAMSLPYARVPGELRSASDVVEAVAARSGLRLVLPVQNGAAEFNLQKFYSAPQLVRRCRVQAGDVWRWSVVRDTGAIFAWDTS